MNQDLNYTYPTKGGDGFVIEKKKNVDSGNNIRVSGFNFVEPRRILLWYTYIVTVG